MVCSNSSLGSVERIAATAAIAVIVLPVPRSCMATSDPLRSAHCSARPLSSSRCTATTW